MELSDLSRYTDNAVELVMNYAPRVLLGLVTLVIGWWFAARIAGLVRRGAEKRKVDETLTPFLVSIVTWALRAAVLISVASVLGIETTSFVALLGAAGLAVGLALQGSLSNFAGGALLLVFRPYRVGDVIEAQGQIGVVKEIQIFTTTLLSAQNRRIIIPNGPMSNGTIINYSVEGTNRVDLVVGVAYDADVERARQIIMDVLKADARILTEPAPRVEVLELADSSVNLAVRPHVKTADYWDVHFDTLKEIKRKLDAAGIEIPFPQRTVHMIQHPAPR